MPSHNINANETPTTMLQKVLAQLCRMRDLLESRFAAISAEGTEQYDIYASNGDGTASFQPFDELFTVAGGIHKTTVGGKVLLATLLTLILRQRLI